MADPVQETTHPGAVRIAAQATGLRPDQVQRAVAEYRAALLALEVEPDWQAQVHMHGSGLGRHQYVAEGTSVTMQIEAWKERGEWKQERYYVFRDKPFESYAEARVAELAESTKPTPYEVTT